MSLPQPKPQHDGLATDVDSRWELMRDVVVLQAKLILEGIRDVALGPIAILAGVLGALRSEDSERARYFHSVLRAGYRFDDWINLYGPLGRLSDEQRREMLPSPDKRVDAYFEKIERVLVEQYEKGGITRSAKDKIDALLDGSQRKASDESERK
jgi:hypothetical protein